MRCGDLAAIPVISTWGDRTSWMNQTEAAPNPALNQLLAVGLSESVLGIEVAANPVHAALSSEPRGSFPCLLHRPEQHGCEAGASV